MALWARAATRDLALRLRRMIGDSDAGVRKRAFAALAQLKIANSAPPVGDAWHLAGRMLEGEKPPRLQSA
jgi:HEAT repeat protein